MQCRNICQQIPRDGKWKILSAPLRKPKKRSFIYYKALNGRMVKINSFWDDIVQIGKQEPSSPKTVHSHLSTKLYDITPK